MDSKLIYRDRIDFNWSLPWRFRKEGGEVVAQVCDDLQAPTCEALAKLGATVIDWDSRAVIAQPAEQMTTDADEAFRAFRNRVASLCNLDRRLLDRELIIRDAGTMSGQDWLDFRSDPARFFVNTDTKTAQAIWACVEARQ